ncbi:MAG: hypothetical protein JSW64_03955 [Candidatus Zixiibacteriota bacterium]|nr:MAG: hypothetical protein JSW64_03955 [candidate division Zixibacteria bacterium]
MKVSSIRWGIIWIGIGLLFLAINFGVLDSLVFPALFSLWPVILIAIGVELIFRKTRFYFLALLSPLLIAAAFIFAAVYAGGYSWSFSEFWKDWSWTYEGRKHFAEQISIDADVDTIRLEINVGDSDLDLSPSPEMIFSVNTNYYKVSPIISHRKEGNVVYLEYRFRENRKGSIFNIKNRDIRNDIKIFDEAWLFAEIETETEYPEFDFSEFKLREVKFSLKAKESKIRFGDNIGDAGIEINGRSEKLILSVPGDFGLELLMDDPDIKRLDDIEGFYRFPDGLRTENYQDADGRGTIILDAIIRNIDIRRI